MIYPFAFLRFYFWIGIFSCLLCACSSNSPTSKSQNRSELRISIANDPIHLNVAKASDSVSGIILRMIHEGLTRLDENANAMPALAEKWDISDDGRHFRFYLRPAVWSNGRPLLAEDFVKAWQYVLDPATASPNAYLLFPIQHARLIKSGRLGPASLGVKAIGEHILEVTLEQNCPYFLQLLAFDAFFPSLVPSLGEKALVGPICSGPFLLESWKIKNELVLKPNPNYWDKEHVKLSAIRIQVLSDAQTALHMYEGKQLDWMGAPLTPLPAEAIEPLAKAGSLESYRSPFTYWVHCNFKNSLLSNVKARQALSLSIDRKLLAKSLALEHEPASSLIPPFISTYHPQYPSLDFDPIRAKQLWKEALDECGLQQSPSLVYIYNSSSLHGKVAQLLQSQWKQNLGLDVSLEGLEWAIFLQRARAGRFDLARFGWPAQFSDPTTFLDIFEEPDGAYNFSRFDNAAFKNEINSARFSQGQVRLQHLASAEKILLQELPVMPLFFESHTYVKHPDLKGVIIGPLGRVDFKFAYWKNSDS